MFNNCKGFTIVEIILSISIFAILGMSTVTVVIGGMMSGSRAQEQTTATAYAKEGIEAINSIRNSGWENITNGTYGVSAVSGSWAVADTSDINLPFTRVITIADVQRLNGAIVSSGGAVDPGTKKITVTVSWNTAVTKNNSIVLSQYLTNWMEGKTVGTIGNSCTLQSDCLNVNTGNVVFSANKRQILGMTLDNLDATNQISITKMQVTWTANTGRRMSTIRIDGTNRWTGSVSSGVIVSLSTTNLPAGSTNIPITYIQFNGSMSGSVFTITCTMADNSTKTVSGIAP